MHLDLFLWNHTQNHLLFFTFFARRFKAHLGILLISWSCIVAMQKSTFLLPWIILRLVMAWCINPLVHTPLEKLSFHRFIEVNTRLYQAYLFIWWFELSHFPIYNSWSLSKIFAKKRFQIEIKSSSFGLELEAKEVQVLWNACQLLPRSPRACNILHGRVLSRHKDGTGMPTFSMAVKMRTF